MQTSSIIPAEKPKLFYTAPLLRVDNLSKTFAVAGNGWGFAKKQQVYAVNEVSFAVEAGETVGLIGESGCGKSTLARCILQLIRPSQGKVWLEDTELTALKGKALRQKRRDMQMIFQNPHSSLNPRMRVGDILAEPFQIHKLASGAALRQEVSRLIDIVGLPGDSSERYPHEFSGGQRQRIGIARALALRPKLIVADEPLSALDVSIQAQILNLMADLKKEFGLTYLMIAHNLDVVQAVCDRVLVMYLGHIVEQGPVDQVFHAPRHPYTQALLEAVPIANPWEARRKKAVRHLLEGEPPSPMQNPQGCPFTGRCPLVEAACYQEHLPVWQNPEIEQHQAACIKADAAYSLYLERQKTLCAS